MSAAAQPVASGRGFVPGNWPRRYTVIGLFFLSTVICYVDRVNVSVAIIPMARQMGYSPATQGLVLSAFFWGYIVSQLAGGWMADRFGGKAVLGFGVACWSLATFLTPPAARLSFPLLLFARILLGVGEGVNFPAIHSLAARWAPARERARALALNYTGIFLGTIAALLASPPLILSHGWPAVFYVSGALGGLWLSAWILKGGNGPEDARGVTAAELDLILSDRPPLARPESIPWGAILRERAVWAIVSAHVCNNWGFYILLLWLPTYLHVALHVPVERVGAYSLVPWVGTFVVGNLAGWISDWMRQRGVSVTAVRKIVQSAGFMLGALPLLLVPSVTNPAPALALITISACCGAMSLAAFGVNHLDIGPRYAGILMGISNTAATVPGIVGVAATGFILGVTGSFAAVFYLSAAVYLIGLAAYLAWASGEPRL
jgi:MFS transporter, ACS family, solute carrier family 17 (sodium-dependent inorganic phosphate cotransporter), other